MPCTFLRDVIAFGAGGSGRGQQNEGLLEDATEMLSVVRVERLVERPRRLAAVLVHELPDGVGWGPGIDGVGVGRMSLLNGTRARRHGR